MLMRMNLTQAQRRVLYYVSLNASASVKDTSETLGLREHFVRRTLQLFFEANVFLRRSVWINYRLLSLEYRVVHLQLPPQSIPFRKFFVELASSAEETVAVVELVGEGQLELRLLTRDCWHLSSFFEQLSLRFNHPFRILRCLTTTELEYSGPSEPEMKHFKIQPLYIGASAEQIERGKLDETDHRILWALANCNYLRLQQVARLISMPAATVQYRISRLEAFGVIGGHFYLIDPTVFNDIPVGLKIRSCALKQVEKEALKTFARQHPRIAWVAFFLGEQSAEIYSLVQNFDQAQMVIEDLSSQLKNILDSVSMTPQLRFFKYSTYPFKNYETLTGAAAPR